MIRINLVRGKRKKRRELNVGSAWLALPLVVLAGTIYFHTTVSGRISKLDADIGKANADIARMVAAIGSRQLMLVSDSCYSGTLAGNERVQVVQGVDAGRLLDRRAVVVMFDGDKLLKVDAPPDLPSERDFVQGISVARKPEPKVLELTDDQRKALPLPPRRDEPMPTEPLGPTRSFPALGD